MATRQICIIGGGIAGLTAAYRLTQQAAESGQDVAVTLLEASQQLGGKLRTSHIAGFEIDEGADAFITRVPYALDLAHELGLEHSLVAPATSQAYLWNGSGLSPIVKQQVLGVPLDLDQLADSGLVSSAGVAAARQDLDRTSPKKPELAPDATVGSVLRQRLGDEISEKLVFPLIGSINAGNCDYLDVRTTAPLIAEAAQQNPSLIRGLLDLQSHLRQQQQEQPQQLQRPSTNAPPVFLAPESGMEELARALTIKIMQAGSNILLNCKVAAVDLAAKTITLAKPLSADTLTNNAAGKTGTSASAATAGTTPSPGSQTLEFDAVILAAPAWATATMFQHSQPETAALLNQIDYCSVAIVTLAFKRQAILNDLDGSGFLVPHSCDGQPTANSGDTSQPDTDQPSADQPLSITACSWTSSKWAHLAGQPRQNTPAPLAILRVSMGRHQADDLVTQSDSVIQKTVLQDLRRTIGAAAAPQQTRISRWPRSFPQYAPGHQELIANIEEQLNPLAAFLAGAGYHGIGVPACIESGNRAATAVAEQL